MSGIRNKRVQHSPKGAPHLGGHNWRTHIDTFVLDHYKVKGCSSFLDIGCGVGGMVYNALDRDYDAYGIDGDFRLERENQIALYYKILQKVLQLLIKSTLI